MGFEILNEDIKQIITDFQTMQELDLKRLSKTHFNILKMFQNNMQFKEDLLLLDNAFLLVKAGKLEYLIREKNSYHNVLWNLHKKFIENIQNPNIKYYQLGKVRTHFSKVEITDSFIKVLVSEHYPNRLNFIKEILSSFNFRIENEKILTIFTVKERNNYLCYFIKELEHEFLKEFNLRFLDRFLKSLKDLDYMHNDKSIELEIIKNAYEKWFENSMKKNIYDYIPFSIRAKRFFIFNFKLYFDKV